MGPLWSGQGTVPHTTVSDLLSTNVLVSPLGALVEAELEAIKYDYVSVHDIDTCWCSYCLGYGRVAGASTKISSYINSTITARRE